MNEKRPLCRGSPGGLFPVCLCLRSPGDAPSWPQSPALLSPFSPAPSGAARRGVPQKHPQEQPSAELKELGRETLFSSKAAKHFPFELCSRSAESSRGHPAECKQTGGARRSDETPPVGREIKTHSQLSNGRVSCWRSPRRRSPLPLRWRRPCATTYQQKAALR